MFSRLVRRSHMYLALFLTPWMLAYAVSTILMNHNAAGGTAVRTKELDRAYATVFEPGTPPRQIAEQILAELNLEGAYGVQGPNPDGQLTINRQDLIAPRRITYSPKEGRLVVERVQFETGAFLNRFHHRRGYQQPYVGDQAMAVSIDIVICAMVFWAASGLWMWWELRSTRLWGAACTLVGLSLFAFFAFAI